MPIIRKSLLLFLAFLLVACAAATSVGFNHLSYPVTTKKVIGKLVLIISKPVIQRQYTIPGSLLGQSGDQTVLAGQMLAQIADYEYPLIFTNYDRVSTMSEIKPGFYRAIMRLSVNNFTLEAHQVAVVLHANIYSYQGKLLYEKSFTGSAKLATSLQAASLDAYRDALSQVNDRLEQLLYWEDHADTGHDGIQRQ